MTGMLQELASGYLRTHRL